DQPCPGRGRIHGHAANRIHGRSCGGGDQGDQPTSAARLGLVPGRVLRLCHLPFPLTVADRCTNATVILRKTLRAIASDRSGAIARRERGRRRSFEAWLAVERATGAKDEITLGFQAPAAQGVVVCPATDAQVVQTIPQRVPPTFDPRSVTALTA